jgi:hypothetical protein
MIHPRILQHVFLVSLVMQAILAVLAHFLGFVPGEAILAARALVAVIGGYLYGAEYGCGYEPCALGGSIAAGAAVVPAVILSSLIGDVTGQMVALATGVCLLAGGAGGAFGVFAEEIRRRNF